MSRQAGADRRSARKPAPPPERPSARRTRYGSGISRPPSGVRPTWSCFRPHPGRSSICEGRPGDGALLADPAGQGAADPRVFLERVEGLTGTGSIGPRLPAVRAARDGARRAVLARVGRVGPALDVLQDLLGGRGLVAAAAGFLSPEGLAATDIVRGAGRRRGTVGGDRRKRGGR